MKLILIRHGMTEANEKRLYCGVTDIRLSEKGKKQLSEKKTDIKAGDYRIITSGKHRCEETLKILFGELPHETDPAFCEMNFGSFEMESYDSLKDTDDYQLWLSGDNEANRTPGGESGLDLVRRVTAALDRILEEDRDTLIVTHGGVIAAIMTTLFPEENKNRYEWQSPPGGGYIIDTKTKTHIGI
ncbi:MAG: histidine phosphatase family protein [Clostridiales bacterium]|nr:histidine phosphatase family protein [Clostridiales bacterium]